MVLDINDLKLKPNQGLTFVEEGFFDKIKEIDLNKARDHFLNNAGLITGGALGAIGLASGVHDHGGTLGSDILAGTIGGLSGAMAGNLVHRTIKKNNEQSDFLSTPQNNSYKY